MFLSPANLPKRGRLDANGENDRFPFYPAKTENKGFAPQTPETDENDENLTQRKRHGLEIAWGFFFPEKLRL